MKINIPSGLFYAVAVVLIFFGALRAYHFGRGERSLSDDDGAQGEPVRTQESSRHFHWGLIYVALGIFLLGSELYQHFRGR